MTITRPDNCFYFYANVSILGWSGTWDLYYFPSLEEATTFAVSAGPSARVTETTQSRIWRVSVPHKDLGTNRLHPLLAGT